MKFIGAGIGEILWDMLPRGKKLGGAPANFSYHLNALGGQGLPVSRIGDDDLGREALNILSDHGLDTGHVSIDPQHPTGRVDVSVDSSGVASYVFPDNVAWDHLTIGPDDLELAASLDAVCFGTLAQRGEKSREAIRTFLLSAKKALKIFDINLRQDFHSQDLISRSLELADVLKINDDELAVVSEMFSLGPDQRESLRSLMRSFGLELAVLTRGKAGSLIIDGESESDLPGQSVSVADTIGAGDAFTAAMALARLSGMGLREMNEYASRVAAFVCTQRGAMPEMPQHFRLQKIAQI